jgi:potassium efflux system protein
MSRQWAGLLLVSLFIGLAIAPAGRTDAQEAGTDETGAARAETSETITLEATAPETPAPDTVPPAADENPLVAWNRTADRAEQILAKAVASNGILEQLRAELADQRTQAFAIAEAGSIAAQSLKAQLDALGPAPKEGETEPAFIAEKRAALDQALAAAREPVVAARQAYSRADVLIIAIDRLIRQRFAERLFQRDPSPLNPAHWPKATSELGAFVQKVREELKADTSPFALGLATVLTLAGFIILVYQRRIFRRFEALSREHGLKLHARAYGALAVTLRFFVPAVAAFLIVFAFRTLQPTSFSARFIIAITVVWPILIVTFYWLGHVIFAPSAPGRRVLEIDDRQAARAVRLCVALGFVLVAEGFIEAAGKGYVFSPETQAVATAIVVLAGSVCLWRLSAILIGSGQKNDEENDAEEHEDSGLNFPLYIGRFIQVAAVAAVLAVAVGYVEFARQALVPSILTLGVFGFAITVHRLIQIVLAPVLGRTPQLGPVLQSFLPLASGVVLVLAMAPLLALIWGARPSDISEVWMLLEQGIEFGNTRISFGVVVVLLVIFGLGLLITQWLQRVIRSSVLPKTRLDTGGKNAIVTGTGYIGVVLSALIAFSAAGLDLSSLAFVAGALSVGIGFGLQAIVSNFVSGIILLVERPIKVGDWIEVGGHSGIVRKIAVRATRVETFDRHEVIVPNSDIVAGAVTNMTLSSKTGRVIVPVGVAYGSDLEKTRQVLLKAAEDNPMIMAYPAPFVLFMGLGDSSLDFELRGYLYDVNNILTARSDLLFAIYAALNEAGIEIPFPQRDLHLRDAEGVIKAIAALAKDGGKQKGSKNGD